MQVNKHEQLLAWVQSSQTAIQNTMAVTHKARPSLQCSQHQEICKKFRANDSLLLLKYGMISDSSSHKVLVRKEQPCAHPPHLADSRKAGAGCAGPESLWVMLKAAGEVCPSGSITWGEVCTRRLSVGSSINRAQVEHQVIFPQWY